MAVGGLFWCFDVSYIYEDHSTQPQPISRTPHFPRFPPCLPPPVFRCFPPFPLIFPLFYPFLPVFPCFGDQLLIG